MGVLKRIAYGFVNVDNFGSRALLWCPGGHHERAERGGVIPRNRGEPSS
ncbi:MAG TPA: hypothetical protein VFF07_12440 [Actinomycetota bacterium]|nr:hypothetical protein [Actinomycetota bacterium]